MKRVLFLLIVIVLLLGSYAGAKKYTMNHTPDTADSFMKESPFLVVEMSPLDRSRFKKENTTEAIEYTLADGTEIQLFMNGTGADATYSEWRSKPDSLFRLYREFYVETESVKVIQHEWYGMSVGIRREYDKSGALITETDIEKSYPFSLPELLSALSDRGVDILRKSEDGSIDGSVSRTTNPIPSYIVSYTNNETMRHTVVFDGSTGAVIHEEDTPLNKINVD